MSFSHLFALSDIWQYPPDGYQLENPPVIGYNLLGEPVVQGYPALTLTWTFMRQQFLTALLAQVDVGNPKTKVTIINQLVGNDPDSGVVGSPLIDFWGMLEYPVIGQRSIIYYQNVALKITHMTPWP